MITTTSIQRTLSILAAAALLGLAPGCSSSSSDSGNKSKSSTGSTGSSDRERMSTGTALPAGAVIELTPPLPTTVTPTGTIFTVKVTSPNGIGISEIPVQLRLSPVKGNQVSTAISTFKRLRPDSPTTELTEEGLVVYGATRAGGVYHFQLKSSHDGGRDRIEVVVGDRHYNSEFDTVGTAK